MGDPLFVGDLKKEIGNVSGVINVVDVRIFNKIGGKSSSAEVSQTYNDNISKEIGWPARKMNVDFSWRTRSES